MKTQYINYIEPIVPIKNFVEKSFSNLTGLVTDIHFSASGIGKFLVKKNSQTVATIFTSIYNKQGIYQGEICLKKKDILTIEFINRDMLAMDMYVSFKYEEK